MIYNQFITEITHRLRRSFPDAVSIQVLHLPHNNGIVQDALCIREADRASSPAIYLEPFWESFRRGVPLNLLTQEMLDCYRDADRNLSALARPLNSFDDIRSCLGIKLVNRERNRELLPQIPHQNFLDLAIVYYISIQTEHGSNAAALIHMEHIKRWNISPEELHQAALKGAAERMPCKIRGIDDYICDIMMSESLLAQSPLAEFIAGRHPDPSSHLPMYIATNSNQTFGASCILYPGMLEAFARRFQCDFYLLPSSIHEVILVPDRTKLPPRSLEYMVQDVNEDTIPEEDFLSDHVYLYQRGKGLSVPLDSSIPMIPLSEL